jgi:hypothetical protein
MLFVVFVDDAPIAAENFRQLFSGELVSGSQANSVCAHLHCYCGTGHHKHDTCMLSRGMYQRMVQDGKARACRTISR